MNKHTDQAIRNTHPTIAKIVYNDPIEAYDASENPVPLDTVVLSVPVSAGNVIMFDPAMAVGTRAIVPLVAP